MVILRSNLVMYLLGCFVLCFLVSSGEARIYEGSGSLEDPFIIDSAADMNDIGNNAADWDSHFLLTADVNLAEFTGTSFNMIGYYSSYYDNGPFNGVFDGNGHTISNFTYAATSEKKVGIFVYIGSGEIKNIHVSNPNVSSIATEYCITSSLVSYMRGGAVRNCSVAGGRVSGYDDVGTVVGYMVGGEVTQCWANDVEVQGEYSTGGLVGGNGGTISECYANCMVQGKYYTGGLIGLNREGYIDNCYAGGEVTGIWAVGGFIGYGVVGEPNGVSVTGDYGDPTVENCYCISEVNSEGGEDHGGFVGNTYPVIGCFWDIEASGVSTSGGGTGKTTAEMQDPNTFISAGWDFVDLWDIDEGQSYPQLKTIPVFARIVSPLCNYPITNTSVDIDVAFTREVFGIDSNDILLGNSAATNAVVGMPIYLGNNMWRFPIAGLSDGQLSVSLATDPNSIVDKYGDDVVPIQRCYKVLILTPVLEDEPIVTLGTNNTLCWGPLANAETYYIECSNEPNFMSIWNTSNWIYNNKYEFNNLVTGETYWYRVKAKSPEDMLWTQSTFEEFNLNTGDNIDVNEVSGDVSLLFLPDILAEDTVGGNTRSWNYDDKIFNVNFFDCTEDSTLKKIEQYISFSSYQTIYFVVYRASPGLTRYYPIYSKSKFCYGGTRFQSSGSISVPLKKRYRYCIGICTSDSIRAYYALIEDPHLSWGNKTGYISLSGRSMPSSVKYSPSNAAFYQKLSVDVKRNYYKSNGNMLSIAITAVDPEWKTVDFNLNTPENTNLTVDVIDALDDSVIIADANNGEDISWVDANSIKLRANLSTNDPNITPELHDWSLTYTDPTTIFESGWSNVECSMQGTLWDALEAMLDPNSLADSNMKDTLLNLVDEALGMVDAELYKDALEKLDLEVLKKTDGCAKYGEPDGDDWVVICDAQQEIYPLILETMSYVRLLWLGQFSSQWLYEGFNLDVDLNYDGCIDFRDFAILANIWHGEY